MIKIKVVVTLKPEILDVQGRAIRESLRFLNLKEVSDVRCGKYFEVLIDTDDERLARQEIETLCDKLLANPIIENYHYELVASSEVPGVASPQEKSET